MPRLTGHHIRTAQTRQHIVTPVASQAVGQLIARTVDVFLPELHRFNRVDGISTRHIGGLAERRNVHKACHVADLATA